MYDPLARRIVHDSYELGDYKYADIGSVIEELTKLRDEGYTKVDIEADTDGYGGASAEFKVVRSRPESDEEYGARMKALEDYREVRRQQYLKLKAEFEGEEVVAG